ncbi:hypothetical protein [Yersinia phage fHe-Yen9-04]|uniref:Lipoprotein n=1 Tax=Yersinia phage fHe-Yen9-04 TaxID=2052742 RepID=A0A2C9CX63_9CAUD|nr:hypothetical protein FDJ41_gp120 [Yersinia phage fHe-Yen9-04]SOK58397.1 hypothetical protein [Yersinia phage fHe-Yen9-04]VUE36166.1 hypothetical protein [Yersinia phage fHe-Yen9-04]
MKIVFVIMAVLMLSSCRVDTNDKNIPVFSGIIKQDPRIITADLTMENNNYHCFSFDAEKDNLIFMCKKVNNEENSSSVTSTN